MLTKKLTKHIWYQSKKYKVIQTFSPNKFDDYILASRLSENHIHIDGKSIPVDMILIDCHNDEFYPDIPKVRKLINDETDKVLREKYKIVRDELQSYWFKMTIEKGEHNEILS